MNKGFVLSNFINIDNELERLFSGSALRPLIDGALILIYNADCSEISLSKKVMKSGGLLYDERTVLDYLGKNAMQKISDQLYVTFENTDDFFLTDLTLFTPSSTVSEKVADFVLLSKKPISQGQIEAEKHLFLSLEYMFYYITSIGHGL